MNSKKGFTLIEILIVIAIMGFLSSIVLVGMSGFRAKGRDAKRIAEMREVQNALELYFSAYGRYPTDTDWASLSTTILDAGIGVNKMPVDPINKDPYIYQYAPAVGNSPSSYILGAVLEDPKNSQLNDDVDGQPAGYNMTFNCNDDPPPAVYCVQF